MKKILVFVMSAALLLAGCGQAASGDAEDVIEIKEKMFITQTNEIYINAEDYIGKTILYEGIFESYPDEQTGTVYHTVARKGPGCCPGVDNRAGFEVRWDGDLPAENDWVEVSGVLKEYELDGYKYYYIEASSLKTLKKRGAEYVTQ